MEDSTTETIRASVEKKFEGDLGHATEAFSALWELANKDDDTTTKVDDIVTPASNASPVVSHF